MSHPQDLSLREQARAIAAGELDPGALLDATLARLDERDGALNSTPVRFPDEARRMLAEAPRGPLHGVPVTVKDMFTLPWRGMFNGTSRELLPPGPSGVFERLRDAGAVVVGVANQHELGMGTTGAISAYGPTVNPHAADRCAGGSSSGSAAAVAARLVAGSVGSDSGGSTRLPAAWCGVVGLKATFGLTPRKGYNGANATVSAGGVFGRDAADARLLAEVVFGRPLPRGDGAALTVGTGPFWGNVQPAVADACRAAVKAWRTVAVDLPAVEHAPIAGAIRAAGELGAALPPELLREIHPLSRAILQYAGLFTAGDAVRADRVRAELRRGLAAAFARCDVIAWPTSPATACRLDDATVELPDGAELADRANVRHATVANLTGVPGISVPVGTDDHGLPIGLQLLAPWGREGVLLDAAEHLQA